MNSLRPRRHTNSTPTERTPLLAGSSRSTAPQNVLADDDDLPHIGSFVTRMRPEDLPKYSLDNLYPPKFQSRTTRTAFSLCSLLYFRSYLGQARYPRERDVWAHWRQERCNVNAAQDVDRLMVQVWEHFLEEEGSSEDVRDVLWSSYPLYPDSPKSIRVVDFLASGDVPAQLLSHPLIYASVVDTWTHGLLDQVDHDVISSRLFHFLDSTGTPRALHIVDLVIYFGFLGLLCNYLIAPPLRAEASLSDPRSILLSLYALSKLFQPWSSATLPHALVLIAFLTSVPSTPLPETFAYTLLLVAFSWKILLLHLPVHQSPLFLLPPKRILPLAVLVWRGLARTFIPVVAFFIPGLFISLVLLSISLNDAFLVPANSLILNTIPSPMASRVVFLGLFAIIFIFLCCALGFSALIHPFLAPHDGSIRSLWDRYSASVGQEARQAYIRTVRAYAAPYYFPAPLNLVHVLLVCIPRAVLIFARRKSTLSGPGLVEKALWRAVVAPFTFAVSTLWLWNLRTGW